MPWKTDADVRRHDKKAKSPKRKRQWRDVANSVLRRTGDEGRAIREANAAVAKAGARTKGRHEVKHGKPKRRRKQGGRKR